MEVKTRGIQRVYRHCRYDVGFWNKQRQWIQMTYTQENVIAKKENQIGSRNETVSGSVELTIQELEN